MSEVAYYLDVRGKSTRFTPPTLSELEIYCSERKNGDKK